MITLLHLFTIGKNLITSAELSTIFSRLTSFTVTEGEQLSWQLLAHQILKMLDLFLCNMFLVTEIALLVCHLAVLVPKHVYIEYDS